jgi:cyclopropane-fatty-acyl-phospholipid synthase
MLAEVLQRVIPLRDAEMAFVELLREANLEINGSSPGSPRILNRSFFSRVLSDGSVGLGDSYMEGWWECERLDIFFDRFLRARLNERACGGLLARVNALRYSDLWRHSIREGRCVATRHYDKGNQIFEEMLDSRMVYSCGYFVGSDVDDLERAQLEKLDLVCRKLALEPGMRLLDVGCGWGALAAHAAEYYGVNVTGATNSVEQFNYARKRYCHLPISWELKDYRQIEGSYDRIVSVGMFEHVGSRQYPLFFETLSRHLVPDGVALLHTIGKNRTDASLDPWIARHIFPNSHLPSLAEVARPIEGRFVMEDCQNIGPHYDPTLMAWHRRFSTHKARISDRYGDDFFRMWSYYLLSCAGAFRARAMQVWQFVLTHPGRSQPLCRITG